MKVRIKTQAKHFGIFYDVQYKVWNLIWRHYTRCNTKIDAINTAMNLEKIPKIYSSWQEMAKEEKKNDNV